MCDDDEDDDDDDDDDDNDTPGFLSLLPMMPCFRLLIVDNLYSLFFRRSVMSS